MKKPVSFIQATCALVLLLCITNNAHAESAVATVNVTVVRFMSIVNISSLDFGVVSVGSTAGSVVISNDGLRFSTGGVDISPSDPASPAKFIAAGSPNSSYFVYLPQSVQLVDQNGNTILLNQLQASSLSGQLDANGNLDLSVGGQINLDANQSPGNYSGTLVIELDYS